MTIKKFKRLFLCSFMILTFTSVSALAMATDVTKPINSDVINYQSINVDKTVSYLNEKNSYIGNKNSVNEIIKASKEENINPAILLSIIGKENGFLPKSNKKAKDIASNPYNLRGGYKTFHPGLYKSSKVAAQTIKMLSADRPKHIGPVKWLNMPNENKNGTYSVDPNWSKGVEKIFLDLANKIGYTGAIL